MSTVGRGSDRPVPKAKPKARPKTAPKARGRRPRRRYVHALVKTFWGGYIWADLPVRDDAATPDRMAVAPETTSVGAG